MIDQMKLLSLKEKYKKIPATLKAEKRWCGYKIEKVFNEKTNTYKLNKMPFNAITGGMASTANKNTWTDFETALKGIIIFNFDGLGIMLGDGITGIDLDNHPDDVTGEYPLTATEFEDWGMEAVEFIDSYSEWSPSGTGIHILCKGDLPSGRNRNSKVVDGLRRDVEMYGYRRFFTVTGDVIRESDFPDRTQKLYEFWKKYVDDSEEKEKRQNYPIYNLQGSSNLNDNEVISKACSASNGGTFKALFDGDMSMYDNDHSRADQALCDKLAFWTNGDEEQIDRIFRRSGLMREKWDRNLYDSTYGKTCIKNAILTMRSGYKPTVRQQFEIKNTTVHEEQATFIGAQENEVLMNIDEEGEPIFRIPETYGNKEYTYDDMGNADRFYDLFGDLFKYNKKSKYFMFWTGKVWQEDSLDYIDKYIKKMSEIMYSEYYDFLDKIKSVREGGDEETAKKLEKTSVKISNNLKRIRGSQGIEAVKKIIASLHDIPTLPDYFNKNKEYINTESGIVDIKNQEILPFDKKEMISMSTHTEVSFDEPTLWIKFLHQIFQRGEGKSEKEVKETEEIIDVVQQILGLATTGYTRQQQLFILYGSGSNGKSTFINKVEDILGDYAKKIDSSVLLAKDSGTNSNVQFSLARLVGTRLLITTETDDNERLSEKVVKDITGGDKINARELYGKGFEFSPQFNIFMATNNLPIIRGTDYGIWRRIFIIPFTHSFKEGEADLDMPKKLSEEDGKILGWCIKGYKKYIDNGGRIVMPDCIKAVVNNYKDDMDVVSRFLNKNCRISPIEREKCTEMYKAYKEWAKDNTDFTMKENNFFKSMKSKGFETIKDVNNDDVYTGVCLKPNVKSKIRGYDIYDTSIDEKGYYSK